MPKKSVTDDVTRRTGAGSAGGPLASEGVQLYVETDPTRIDRAAWNALLALQPTPTPFMRHEYLCALHTSGSATPATGWHPHWLLLRQGDALLAACPLYLKDHSWGEYVFDLAWARAYEAHGLAYYPKALVAVPFTPVPGTRLMARDAPLRQALAQALQHWCAAQGLSSLHVLLGDADDLQACRAAGWMVRDGVQFHWKNAAPTLPGTSARQYRDFDDFLAHLTQEKRKKIRQERRRVHDAGVRFRWARGSDIAESDWDFFYRCHQRTYLEHGQRPYLQRAFFDMLAREQPEAWLMFTAHRDGQDIATSLIALNGVETYHGGQKDTALVAYGRYWGALQRVHALHFEACYYQPIAWCIEHGVAHFEGGAQGEHKMARALLPTATHSAHWLAHPDFADAVDRFLHEETQAMASYLDHLEQRSPLRRA